MSDGIWLRSGEFRALPRPETPLVEELFRHVLLRRLPAGERLSGEFLQNLLSWRHSGFSVHAGERLYPEEARLERLARNLARPPLAAGRVKIVPGGLIRVETPPHPRTGKTGLLLDALDFVHARMRRRLERVQRENINLTQTSAETG